MSLAPCINIYLYTLYNYTFYSFRVIFFFRVPCILQQDSTDVAAVHPVAGRRSSPAVKKQPFQRNHNQSRSLDLVPGQEEAKQGSLGMSPELAAWWGKQGGAGDMGADPLQGWLGREQQARAIYKR